MKTKKVLEAEITDLNRVLQADQNTIKLLNEELEREKANAKTWSDKWIESQRDKGSAIADKIKVEQLEKQLLVINHITAGRVNEAIQEILKPMPVLFSLDVHFADNATKLRAEDELLEKVKAVMTDALKGVKLKREKHWEAEHKDGTLIAEFKE